MWETELPPERLQLHHVYRTVTEIPIAVQIYLCVELPLYSKTHVQVSHVSFQPITNTAH